jgi:acetylornithine deacetylase/succinyl-diaminopimelate desuccinylase family protein
MIDPQRLVRQIQKVLSFNSENPPGNEFALAQYIERDMRSLGLSVRTFPYVKKRPNVVAVLKGALPRKQAAARSILISPHFDTVPIGENWAYDPLGKDIVGGRIYGRGASDDKGNTGVAMEVMRSLVEDGVRLKHDVIFAATVDEETGSHAGIIPLLEKKVLTPGYALILDSDECHAIIAQKGLIHCRVKIFGKKAHGAYNWRGKNAIEIASRVIMRLKEHSFLYKKHQLLRPPTVNIGTIRGGDKVNMVADFCEFSVDLRFLPGTKAAEVLKTLKALIRKETTAFDIVIDDLQQPYEIKADHPFVKVYLDTAHKMRIAAAVKGSEGATVMTFFQKHKIPAFATGFGTGGTAHSTDEYAKITTLVKGAHLLERFLINFDQKIEVL